jgi:hypothetical protein
MICLHSSGILFDWKIRLNNLVSQTIAIEGFSKISKPLTKLLEKDKQFE